MNNQIKNYSSNNKSIIRNNGNDSDGHNNDDSNNSDNDNCNNGIIIITIMISIVRMIITIPI